MAVIDRLAGFAAQYRDLPCLSFTHLQPAQPTTVGRRACLWAYDLVLDLQEVEHRLETLAARSTKGTTGTQASFLELFDGDHAKVRRSGTTGRREDGIRHDATPSPARRTPGKSTRRSSTPCRALPRAPTRPPPTCGFCSHRKEIEEPFEADQIGSSAMAYKRNPMRCERICSLARYVMSLPSCAAQTMAVQWMERTLDDSANRRIILPQAFLAVDAILILYQNVASGLVVYPQVIARNLREELPFMATENILMDGVAAGGDRQDLHERIRRHSVAAATDRQGRRQTERPAGTAGRRRSLPDLDLQPPPIRCVLSAGSATGRRVHRRSGRPPAAAASTGSPDAESIRV